MKPLWLDTFCCAGGASEGYSRAGYEVIGVDVKPQPNYPFHFLQGDALSVLNGLLFGMTMEADDGFRFTIRDLAGISASPPCQGYSDLAFRNDSWDDYPKLIEPVRKLLIETGLPYVIENVEGAPLDGITLCGTMFPGLRVIRHRVFESNVELDVPEHSEHPLVFTHDKRKKHHGQLDQDTSFVQVTGGGNSTFANARSAMGLTHELTKRELNEAIPPAYTEHIGRQIITGAKPRRLAPQPRAVVAELVRHQPTPVAAQPGDLLAAPTYLSAFAGIGGFDLGLDRAGLTGVGQIEINDFCLKVLARHWPGVPRHTDIRTAPEWWESEPRPELDVLCGGFPCQDISLTKPDREGLDGDKSGLYWELLRLAVAAQPRLVVLENVAHLVASNYGRDLSLIVGTLADCGYPYVEWRTLDSANFGVAQSRRRLFLVAGRGDPCGGPLLFDRDGGDWSAHADTEAARGQAAPPAAEGDPGDGADWRDVGPEADADRVRTPAGLPRWLDRGLRLLPSHPRRVVTGTLTGSPSQRGHRLDDGGINGHHVIVPAVYAHYRGLDPADVVQPPGGCGCCPVEQKPDTNRYGGLGNAVSPPVAEWIGHRLYDEVLLQRLNGR